MLPAGELRRVLLRLQRIPIAGPFYRAVKYDYLVGPPPDALAGTGVQPLWAHGAAQRGARFTPMARAGAPNIACLYLAQDEMTPIHEVAETIKSPGVPVRFPPQVLMTIEGVLGDILDLTDLAIQSRLGTSRQELTRDWLIQQSDFLEGKAEMPPTQILGMAAFATTEIVGLRYGSTKNASGLGVVVFTDRLAAAKHLLEIHTRGSKLLQSRIP